HAVPVHPGWLVPAPPRGRGDARPAAHVGSPGRSQRRLGHTGGSQRRTLVAVRWRRSGDRELGLPVRPHGHILLASDRAVGRPAGHAVLSGGCWTDATLRGYYGSGTRRPGTIAAGRRLKPSESARLPAVGTKSDA